MHGDQESDSAAGQPAPTDLSGRWRGHYEQDGHHHGISMQIEHRGDRFTGEMRDEHSVFLGPLSAEPGNDVIAGAVQVAASEEPNQGVVASLPECSTIDGQVDGQRVVFTKLYQGPQTFDFWLGSQGARLVVENPTIAYEGQVDARGTLLFGEWRLGEGPDDPLHSSGTFEMHRVDAD